MNMKILALSVSALAILGLATRAAAGPNPPTNPDAPSVKISIVGLDLGRHEGAKVALHRIHDAARRVCQGESFNSALDLPGPYAMCLNATVDHAVGLLDSPLVTALNTGHGRRSTVLAANPR